TNLKNTNIPMIDLAIVSDEITLDFPSAVKIALEWDLRKFEIRSLRTGRIPKIDPLELLEIEKCVRNCDIKITAISPGIFKSGVSDEFEIKHQLSEDLPRAIEVAQALGTDRVIIFGFQRESGDTSLLRSKVIDYLSRAAELAHDSGVTLLLENEPGFWADSGTNTFDLLNEVSSDSLRANWDPCNAFGLEEEPFPAGYEKIKPYISGVHAKDTRLGSLTACVPIGEGLVDWNGQIQALVRDGIVDHITVETHCLPLIDNSRLNVNTLRRLINLYQTV
ncbi:MAG: sugar phosphate isomerase/epimerase family protein, partial [Candidatus Kryptoniota bacterium]